VLEPPLECGQLVRLVEDLEGPLELRLWRVLKWRNVCSHDGAVHDKVALPVQHVRNHEDLYSPADLFIIWTEQNLRLVSGDVQSTLVCVQDAIILSI
jgi:hypothetical protein